MPINPTFHRVACTLLLFSFAAFSSAQDQELQLKPFLNFKKEFHQLKDLHLKQVELQPAGVPDMGNVVSLQPQVELDTARWTLNVVKPRTNASLQEVMEVLDSLPSAESQVFTVYQNSDGSGVAMNYVAMKDATVELMHAGLVGTIKAEIENARARRDALDGQLYTLGLLVVILSALATLIAAVFSRPGGKGMPFGFTLAVALIGLGTTVGGWVVSQKSGTREKVVQRMEKVKEIRSEYMEKRSHVAAEPKSMIELIETTSDELALLD